jgi:hypothetical protein
MKLEDLAKGLKILVKHGAKNIDLDECDIGNHELSVCPTSYVHKLSAKDRQDLHDAGFFIEYKRWNICF